MFSVLKIRKNKTSAESGVAPARIKSHKFLFELKKNLLCSIQETDGLVCKKNRQSRKFGMPLSGIWYLEEEWVTDSQCHSVLGSNVSGDS